MSTTFPNTVENFKRWENLTSAQLTAYINYINALNEGDWTRARQVFSNGGLSENMLPTADDFNKMCDTILECKALYEAPKVYKILWRNSPTRGCGRQVTSHNIRSLVLLDIATQTMAHIYT